MAKGNPINNDYTMGVTALIALAAIRKLGDKADGLSISTRTGIKQGYLYNLLGRVKARGYITIERKGIHKLYALTDAGSAYFDSVKAALR